MKKKKRNLIIAATLLVGLLWWIFSDDYDSSKPTEFYAIENGIYVVHNAPYDTLEIKKVIEKFNLETLPVDTIKKYGGYGRQFLRETKYMTRNFKEGNEYDPVYRSLDNTMDYRNHRDDVLMYTSYSIMEDGRIYYSYWLNCEEENNPDNIYYNYVYILFNDLDSLYAAKKKEYGIVDKE